jgi:hypothetical protein
MAIGVKSVRVGREQQARLAAVERRVVDTVGRRVAAGMVGREVQEMPAVGQEERPAVRGMLLGVDVRRR